MNEDKRCGTCVWYYRSHRIYRCSWDGDTPWFYETDHIRGNEVFQDEGGDCPCWKPKKEAQNENR